jgi:hypothetical protein
MIILSASRRENNFLFGEPLYSLDESLAGAAKVASSIMAPPFPHPTLFINHHFPQAYFPCLKTHHSILLDSSKITKTFHPFPNLPLTLQSDILASALPSHFVLSLPSGFSTSRLKLAAYVSQRRNPSKPSKTYPTEEPIYLPRSHSTHADTYLHSPPSKKQSSTLQPTSCVSHSLTVFFFFFFNRET